MVFPVPEIMYTALRFKVITEGFRFFVNVFKYINAAVKICPTCSY